MTTKQAVLFQLLAQPETWLSGDKLAQEIQVSRESVWKAIQALKKAGHQIESRKNQGYRYLGNPNLDLDSLNFYSGFAYSEQIQVFEVTDSTQIQAKNYLNQHTVNKPYLFVANQQSDGYGRRGRDFYSPSQTGLYFSLILPNPSQDLSQVGLLTTSIAVLVSRVLERFFPDKNFKLKWVNDIYLGQKKVAGIITEANLDLETQSLAHFIVGVGLNLSPADFPESLQATAQAISDEPFYNRNQLMVALFTEIVDHYREYQSPTLLAEYRQKSFLLGRQVTLQRGTESFHGQVSGISDDGSLQLITENEKILEFNSGEITKVYFK